MHSHSLRGYMAHKVTRSRRSSTEIGAKGDPAWGPQTTLRARVEKTFKMVRTPNGREIIASHVMATDEPVELTDRYWLPSIGGELADDTTSASAARAPLSVEVATDKAGKNAIFRVYFA